MKINGIENVYNGEPSSATGGTVPPPGRALKT
jgi:hypothetical protein